MKKTNKTISAILSAVFVLPIFTATVASADNGTIYDGKYNVYGFDYSHYDDEIMRCGGYDSGYDPDYDYTTDWQEVKYFIDENFVFNKNVIHSGEEFHSPSGWDVDVSGGKLADKYFYHQALVDTSVKFPVELNRKFETANHGRLNFEFIYVPVEKQQDGITFRLYEGNKTAVGFVMHEDGLYLEQNGSDDVFVGTSAVRPDNTPETSWQGELKYNNGVRAVINLDTCMIEKIFFGGKLVVQNKPFTNTVGYIDNCNINTGDKNVGELWMRGVRLYRGYPLHDQFLTAQLNVPDDYTAKGDVRMMGMDSGTPWDNTNMVIGTGGSVSKSFEHVKAKQMVFEYHMYQPEKTAGFELSLSGDGKETLKFSTDGSSFLYNTNELLYENYFPKVWYKLRAYLDLEKKTAALYVNGIKRFENIPLGNDSLDTLSVKNSGNDTYVDFFRLWYDSPEPEDYCPEPVPVKPKDGIELGMQFCPMWRNGYHVGWDSLNMDKRRIPYIGFYDEGNPEVNDWITKDLLEHGFTFQRIAVIGDTPGPYCNPTFGNQFIDEGYKYGKYSDMMPYCVLLETGSVFHPTKEYFMESYLPYLIEHYFKDPRYFKIDGRPVLSCWIPANLMSYAGTIEDSKRPISEKKDLCREFIADIRKLCIESGVGDPIIAGNIGADEESLKLYKEIGFDAALPYGSESTVEGQIDVIDRTVELKDVMDRSIVVSPGLDGTVWQAPGTAIIKSEDYRKVLEHYLSVRNQFDKKSLAYKMLCFDTFDEFGEGHWVAPSGGEGYGYYDEVYRAFVGKDPLDHKHVVPTTKQKDRFNNCYPPNRRLQTIDVVESAPTHEIEGSTVLKGWYFDTDGDIEGWNAGNDVGGLTASDGCLTGKVTGRDSQIYSPKLDIDYRGLIQAKIRVKYNSKTAVTQNQLFYVCKNGKSWSESQSVIKGGSWNKDSGYTDFIYPLAGSGLQANLTQLRFDVVNHMPKDLTDAEFMIDSIELLYNKEYDTTEKEEAAFNNSPSFLKNGETVTGLNSAPIQENGRWYYPLRQISVLLGGKVDYDGKSDITTILNGDAYAQIYNAEQKGYVNGGTLRANPVVIENEGTSYVTEKLFRLLFAKELSYDEASKTIAVSDLSTGVEKTREVIEGSEFDIDGDTEGWSVMQSVSQLTAANGQLTGKISGDMPILVKGNMSLKGADIKNIHISMTNNTNSASGDIYFLTNTDKQWNESKHISFKIPDTGKSGEVSVDPSVCAAWGGTITDIRFDPGAGANTGDFAIDFILFEGDYKAVADNVDSMTRIDNEIKWDFNFNSAKDGWIFGRQFGDCKVADGILSATVIGPSPKLYTISDLGIDSSMLDEIEIKYKNATTGSRAKLWFLADDESEYDNSAAAADFAVTSNDTESRSYIIKAADINGLRGTINGVSFMPTDGKGSIEIDYICFVMKEQ